ncbi:MAG: DUF3025 domain-containing protein [Betaproteobacteria bacterium]|nr:DUF3025 domain-containing protein [Betaproteobacteria bacterium]
MAEQHAKALGGTAQNDSGAAAPLGELARRPLFEPLRALLEALPGSGPCDLAALNALFSGHAEKATDDPAHQQHQQHQQHQRGVHTAGPIVPAAGAIRLVAPDDAPIAYEQRIVARAEIVTRPHNWHDFFNALVWLRFPQTKHRLAALHAAGMKSPARDGRRGPIRDAATQFDESGIVVAASDAHLLDLLAERRWKDLFWARRRDVGQRMRFVVFGHGLYDALRAPFYRICGRAAVVVVPQTCIDAPAETLCARVDPILAERFARRTWYPRPKTLLALPLLGIPGVCAGNEDPAYYDDAVQFRPPPRDPAE